MMCMMSDEDQINDTEINDKDAIFHLQAVIKEISEGDTFGNTLNVNPMLNEAFYSIGYSFYQQGNYRTALKYFEHVIFIDHYDSRALSAAGKCLKKLGEYEKAIKTLCFAQLNNDDDADISMDIVDCLLKIGNLKKAQELLNTIIFDYGRSEKFSSTVEKAKRLCALIQS